MGEMGVQLATEHTNETKRLFDEVVALRTEMANVQDLLQGYLERDKILSEMMDAMTTNFQETHGMFQQLHGDFAKHAQGALGDHDQQRQLLGDPIKDAKAELARIKQNLSQPAVPPPSMPAHLHQVVRQGGRMI